jgi:hypothetical protein
MRGQKLREREGRKNAVQECVAQMEELARLAYEAKRALEVLEDAFTGLGDWPEHFFLMLGEMMPRGWPRQPTTSPTRLWGG